MELAVITAEKISVMFIMALIGMICYRIGLISGHTNEKLSDILLLLVSPLLIFTSYQQAFDPEKLNGLLAAFFMAAVSHAVAIATAAFLVKKGRTDWEVERISSIYSNCGFMGIPLVSALFGADGVFYATAYITVFNVLVWTHGVILMTGKQDFKSFLTALRSPCIVAVVLGLFCALPISVLLPCAHPVSRGHSGAAYSDCRYEYAVSHAGSRCLHRRKRYPRIAHEGADLLYLCDPSARHTGRGPTGAEGFPVRRYGYDGSCSGHILPNCHHRHTVCPEISPEFRLRL